MSLSCPQCKDKSKRAIKAVENIPKDFSVIALLEATNAAENKRNSSEHVGFIELSSKSLPTQTEINTVHCENPDFTCAGEYPQPTS
jgi:hypothetical protein